MICSPFSSLESICNTAQTQLEEAMDGWCQGVDTYYDLQDLAPPPAELIRRQLVVVAVLGNKIRCLGQSVAAAVFTAGREGLGFDHQIKYCRSLTELAHKAVTREEQDEASILDFNVNGVFVLESSARVAAEAAFKAEAKEAKDAKDAKAKDTSKSFLPSDYKRARRY